jgi:predicted nucleic acid-binding protein
MSEVAIKHERVILDACCLINLYASGRIDDILASLSKPVFVARYVWSNEALTVNGAHDSAADMQETRIDLESQILGGLLGLADLETEDEEILFVNFAANLDDGEAITGAIAAARNWCIATDDRRARNVFADQVPQIQLLSSPELVKHWADVTAAEVDEICLVVQRIRRHGHFVPPASHFLYTWWQNHL